MRKFKKYIIAFICFLCVTVVLQEWIYTNLVTYKPIGIRANFEVSNPKFQQLIECKIKPIQEVDDIINLTHSITSDQLSFSSAQRNRDPNQLIKSNKAHCVGYASFYTATCNYLFKKHNIDHEWQAKSYAGKIFILGINVHTYVDSPFFKDHDFVIIENRTTGERIGVDPSLSDYSWIKKVTLISTASNINN